MDESFLKEHIGRCKSLADISTSPFIKRRLLALAAQYEAKLQGAPLPLTTLANLPVNVLYHDELKATQ
jgi:hypothetical protein